MIAAFADLAVGLATVAQIAQQVGDDALTEVEALFAQRFDEMTLAAADPTQGEQGSPRIADSIKASSAAGRPGCRATALLRPPPGRRTRRSIALRAERSS